MSLLPKPLNDNDLRQKKPSVNGLLIPSKTPLRLTLFRIIADRSEKSYFRIRRRPRRRAKQAAAKEQHRRGLGDRGQLVLVLTARGIAEIDDLDIPEAGPPTDAHLLFIRTLRHRGVRLNMCLAISLAIVVPERSRLTRSCNP